MSLPTLIRAVFVASTVVLCSCNRNQPDSPVAGPAGGPDSSIQSGADLAGAKQEPPADVSPLVGKPAPDVEGELFDSSKFSLKEQYAKNVVMLDFWATWCGPCVEELPVLMKLAEKYKDKGVVLYAVDEEDAETISKFLQEKGWKLNAVLDPDGEHGKAYGVSGIPQLVLIDKGGIVRNVHVGYGDGLEELLSKELDAILAAHETPQAAPAN